MAGIVQAALAQKQRKATLVFTGVQREQSAWQLCFQDRWNKRWCFNAQRSRTDPYVFFRTNGDGSLKENDKVKGSWFLVSYAMVRDRKQIERIITAVEISSQPR
jgi:hypothetical protein